MPVPEATQASRRKTLHLTPAFLRHPSAESLADGTGRQHKRYNCSRDPVFVSL